MRVLLVIQSYVDNNYQLRQTIYLIPFHLLITFNFSRNMHEMPLDWSSAYITPIYKKGSLSDLGNIDQYHVHFLIVIGTDYQ